MFASMSLRAAQPNGLIDIAIVGNSGGSEQKIDMNVGVV